MSQKYPIYFNNKFVDWVKFLERKRSAFIYFPFVEIETKIMPLICDFRFYHHLFKWSDDLGTHYRSSDELVLSNKHFLELIKNKDSRLKIWAQKGFESHKISDNWLKKSSEAPVQFSIENFNSFYQDFIEVLLYTATMPYLVLSAIDAELTKGAKRELFQEALDLFEPLRNTSKYPELERTVLGYWFDELGKKYSIDPIYINFMTPDEIRNMNAKLVDLSELKQRKKWSIFWNDIDTNKIIFSFDQDFKKLIPILTENIVHSNEIRGTVAYPGLVKGEVKIVNLIEDIKKFKAGNILVSLNTNPDLISAISLAGAIITDEGGIMCHAAIVARELKKPCIIGTKIATKVLKDGDMVEVDANNGIIRIIK